MKRILTALVLIPLVILLVFFGPDWAVTLAVGAVALLAAWEYIGIAKAADANPPRVAVLVAIALLFAVSQLWPDKLSTALGALSLALLLYCTFSSPIAKVLHDSASSIFCLIYIGFTLISLPALRSAEDGKTLVTFLLCVVWAGDIVALYVGRNLGRHKLAPRLSPNKTWEGAVGSVVGSLLVTVGLIVLAEQLAKREIMTLAFAGPVWHWLLLAVVVNVAAQVGDLAESALKRSAGVKDSGTLLPGHGGVLDRIDALLLAAPVLWYAQVIQHF
ncbi:phosphatidate cytidylyltransferase [Acidicapsa ligni]|uniref:phosphatidate cytidylyltransferase n=1 Tax=Acidicapsa ligni TaxID=542300 RepID=UPI0021E08693|nr:phosphatidate cytidylyltransferase [Acidicapsa ligni]